ncbi:MAG: pantoate--beta-alanine ligase [Chitinophagaceae bacterium]|nr:pantoate--beta-alanine ligase [Chitinophagaceae bacterium]MCW5914094.1 pantoate--beta-alanine ligase [Chitinophagaceae bacterium]MCZ2396075.1 pantoate--beta-alanine ligase [Chitinophagales bacterium]
MRIIKHPASLKSILDKKCLKGSTVGFVPTMGALHEGHLSLVRASLNANHLTVVSIFVNPLQFNDATDLEKYPVTIEKDILLLSEAGTDILFLPGYSDVYPEENPVARAHYDLGSLESVFEGKYRPGHFQGVCAVVDRLLSIVAPTDLYLGQKDFQQVAVLRKMIQLKNHNTKIVVCPIVREQNGLAMSSRNARLSPAGKEKAGEIYQCLKIIKEKATQEPFETLKALVIHRLSENDIKTEYLALADTLTLEEVHSFDTNRHLIILIAAIIESVRLIDNMPLQ